ncbi:MAG: caspase family protein [Acidobacteriota bacterium]
MADDDYGLVVGINEYAEPPGALEGAKQDARDFLDWLKSSSGANVPEKNVDPFVRLSDAKRTEPTYSTLLTLLVAIRKRAPGGSKKRVGRRLYIFLAGHGISPPTDLDETGLVTVEAEDQLMPCLPGKQSADGFVLTGRFDEVLLFMDCCRVTDLLQKQNVIPIVEKPDPNAAAKVKRFYVYAAAFGKPAREVRDNGVTRGIFSRVLIDALRGAASPDPDGRLTTTQLRAYLEREMKNVVINGEEQVPKFPSTDEIVLVHGLTPRRVAINVTFAAPIDHIAVLDGGNRLAPVTPDDMVATATGCRFSVPAARTYLLVARNAAGASIGFKELKAEGEQIDVTL